MKLLGLPKNVAAAGLDPSKMHYFWIFGESNKHPKSFTKSPSNIDKTSIIQRLYVQTNSPIILSATKEKTCMGSEFIKIERKQNPKTIEGKA